MWADTLLAMVVAHTPHKVDGEVQINFCHLGNYIQYKNSNYSKQKADTNACCTQVNEKENEGERHTK